MIGFLAVAPAASAELGTFCQLPLSLGITARRNQRAKKIRELYNIYNLFPQDNRYLEEPPHFLPSELTPLLCHVTYNP